MKDNCPICFGKLEQVKHRGIRVMDGNSVYQCVEDVTHRFWSHPFSYKVLRLYPNASIMCHEWLKAYEYDNRGDLIFIHINEKAIGE